MAINLGDKPPAGPSEPIDMMQECHRRIEHFLDVLHKVEQRYGDSVLDDQGRRALEASLNYFANFAPLHTADEEQSLFPRMRRIDNPDAQTVMAEIERLEHDHRHCENCHAIVDAVVRDWLATGRLSGGQRDRLRSTLDELTKIYTAHIEIEERRVFPIACRILTPQQIYDIGVEVRKRRA